MSLNGFKLGDRVVINRKPGPDEYACEDWIPDMDPYLGTEGKIIEIIKEDIDILAVEHSDGMIYYYPEYCLVRKKAVQVSCSCKLEILMLRGCHCGAMAAEQTGPCIKF